MLKLFVLFRILFFSFFHSKAFPFSHLKGFSRGRWMTHCHIKINVSHKLHFLGKEGKALSWNQVCIIHPSTLKNKFGSFYAFCLTDTSFIDRVWNFCVKNHWKMFKINKKSLKVVQKKYVNQFSGVHSTYFCQIFCLCYRQKL